MKTFEEAWNMFFKAYSTHSGTILGWSKESAKNIFEKFYQLVEDDKNE